MAPSIYDEYESKSSDFFAPNIITIARALDGKRLNKTIFSNGQSIPYDNAYHFKFFSETCSDLQDLYQLVKLLLHRPKSCLIRGIAKDDTITRQRRLLHNQKEHAATIIEQNQNWFALDIDGYGNSSGDIKQDAAKVLLALKLDGVEAFAIPSANYLIKQGIRLRLFLWNECKISCASLKAYFSKFNNVVDCALFHPIHPIYTARPRFVDMPDPCRQLITWLPGRQMYTEIIDAIDRYNDGSEKRHTKKYAVFHFNKILRNVFNIDSNRHDWLLREAAIPLGKYIWEELLDEDEVIEELHLATAIWGGDRKRDLATILYGIKRGKLAMEDNSDAY